jgi:hypothetical protein
VAAGIWRRDRARGGEFQWADCLLRGVALSRRRLRRLLADAEREHGVGGARRHLCIGDRRSACRAKAGPRVKQIEEEIAEADEPEKRLLRARLEEVIDAVRSEKLGEVAEEFDRVHSVHRALDVGSLDRIIAPSDLRAYLIGAVERGMGRAAAAAR